MKKIIVLLMLIVVTAVFASCTSDETENNVAKDGNPDLAEKVSTENTDNTDMQLSFDSKSELLPNTYKVPKQEIYVDVPDFNEMEKGYTELFRDGERKYVAFTDLREEFVENEKEAFERIFPKFANNMSSLHKIKGTPVLTESSAEINGIATHKFSGTVECGFTISTDCYIYGYSFIFNDVPCLITGVVSDKTQSQKEIDSVTAIVDAMMKSVRNEK